MITPLMQHDNIAMPIQLYGAGIGILQGSYQFNKTGCVFNLEPPSGNAGSIDYIGVITPVPKRTRE